jgi:hypothetical protein
VQRVMRDSLAVSLSIVQGGGVLSRLGGGRAAAWLLVAVFAVLATVAVLRTGASSHPGGAPTSAPHAKPVLLPGSIPLAALPTPLPDESATGASPAGQLTIIDPPGPAVQPASVAPGPSGVPGILYAAYLHTQQVLAVTAPNCHLGWGVLAAIGRAESGQAQGATVDANGATLGRILGPRLDGSAGLPRVTDTDQGRLDGDPTWDRAVGPMQIVPSVWQRYGADGDGDGIADPNDMFDAALTAGRYLCAGGMDLNNQEQRTAALYRYNQSDSFVSAVRSWAEGYGQGAASVPVIGPIGPPADGPVPVDVRSPGTVAPPVDRPPHRPSVRRPPQHRSHRTTRAANPSAPRATEPNSPGTPLTPYGRPNVVVPPAPGTTLSAGAPSDRVSSGTPSTTTPTTLYPGMAHPTTTYPSTTNPTTTYPDTSTPSTSAATPTTTYQPSTATTSPQNNTTIRVRPVPASELPSFSPSGS